VMLDCLTFLVNYDNRTRLDDTSDVYILFV